MFSVRCFVVRHKLARPDPHSRRHIAHDIFRPFPSEPTCPDHTPAESGASESAVLRYSQPPERGAYSDQPMNREGRESHLTGNGR